MGLLTVNDQLLLSVNSRMRYYISFLITAMGFFPLLVCLSYGYIPLLGTHIDMDGQEDDFYLIYRILMN